MDLEIIDFDLAICKVNSIAEIDFNDEFYFASKTDDEISLVCKSDNVPSGVVECDMGWKSFRIKGILDFSLIGVISEISGILAENDIGIFVVSTFNTDYVMVKKESFDKAMEVLANEGYCVI